MPVCRHAFVPVVALALLCIGATTRDACAEEVTVAVAANFLQGSRALGSEFETVTGHQVRIASGSTGQLYGQIVNGAPFDILLAADQERPRLLAEKGLGDPASVFSYAIGHLALWSADPDRVSDSTLKQLLQSEFRWFAIAEPKVAPYGKAAMQTLENLGVWQALEPRIVRGQNVAQTFALIQTHNADLGFIALSQAVEYGRTASYRLVPGELHEPIRQDAILLTRASGNSAARDFLEFLQSPAAAAIIERLGYAVAARHE